MVLRTVRAIILIICINHFFLTGILIAAPVNSLSELESAISQQLKDVKTMAVDFEHFVNAGPKGSITATGKMFFLLPHKMKMIYSSELMGQQVTTTMINDGTMLWTESRMGPEFVQVFKVKTSVLDNIPNISKLSDVQNQNLSFDQVFNALATLKKFYTLTWKGLTKLENKNVYFVVAKLTSEGKKQFESLGPTGVAASTMCVQQLLYYDPDTFFLKKMVLRDAEGNETLHFVFSHHQKNVELKPEIFIYEPPEGSRVVDMTPMLEQMYQTPIESKGENK